MCAPKDPNRPAVKKVTRNMTKSVPLDTKIKQIATNMWIRVSKLQTCCGHPGQAGC
jgi:hypothetical protein